MHTKLEDLKLDMVKAYKHRHGDPFPKTPSTRPKFTVLDLIQANLIWWCSKHSKNIVVFGFVVVAIFLLTNVNINL